MGRVDRLDYVRSGGSRETAHATMGHASHGHHEESEQFKENKKFLFRSLLP